MSEVAATGYPTASHGRQVGLAVSAASVPGTFAASLTKRTWAQQGMVTGVTAGATYLVTLLTQEGIEAIGRRLGPVLPFRAPDPLTQAGVGTLLVDLAMVPAGLAVARLLPPTPDERLPRAGARQAFRRLAVTGVGAATFAGVRAASLLADQRLGRGPLLSRLPLEIPAGLGIALLVEHQQHAEDEAAAVDGPPFDERLRGFAAAGGVVLLLGGLTTLEAHGSRLAGQRLAEVLPGGPRLWQSAAHAVALGGLGAAVSTTWGQAVGKIESGASQLAPNLGPEFAARYVDATVSGGPGSLVPWETLGREGRRHAALYVRAEPLRERPADLPDLSVPAVMGVPAVATPVAVYVGLDSAPTAAERVELALAELDRTGGWDRSLLMLVSPTGSGYVNYCATAAAQYFTLGDVATVTLQYSKRPSPLSLGKVGAAREQNRLLWLRIAQRLRERPPERRPRVVVFGESLGAHTSQDVFMHWGTLGPQALGIDRALWIGTPYFSKWRQQVVGAPRPDVDRDLVAVVNDFGQIEAMEPRRRSKLRYVLISHDNDGVTKFTTDLLAKPPSWLQPGRPPAEEAPPFSPRGIPPAMRWRPITTFLQTLVDMMNAQVPGEYMASGHDYRPDLPAFVREVFGLSSTDEQLAAVTAAVERREQLRLKEFDEGSG
jgi:hypothetical protein